MTTEERPSSERRPAVGPGEARPPLRATIGEPALLDLARGPLPLTVPLLPAPAPPARQAPPLPGEPTSAPPLVAPPPLSLAELQAGLAQATRAAEAPEEEPPREAARDAEPPPSRSDAELERAYFGEAVPEEEVVFDRARAALEDLALLGAMRRPLEDQGWAGRAEAERRLLARVDAIAACGGVVLPRLVKLIEDRPVPDPELTWALVFLFGSLAGEDALDQAMLLARAAPATAPEVLAAAADALALAPHPGVDGVVRPWLGDSSPELRAAGARILGRRGSLSTGEALDASRDADARVAAAGAAALASSAGPVQPAALWELAHHADESVARAAMEAAFVRRSDVGLRRACKLVEQGQPEFSGAALLVALGSGPEGRDILEGAAAAGSPAVLEALGWYGHPASVDLLLARLERGGAPAAVAALQRITGASLTDADPDPEYPPDALPFTRPGGAVPRADVLSADPALWRGWWERHGKRARPDLRHRFGHPWSPRDGLSEMEDRSSIRRDRRAAFLELCARSGGVAPFDVEAFVARQRRQLAAWAEVVAARRGSTGTWPVRLAR